jgi:hypothetical protein
MTGQSRPTWDLPATRWVGRTLVQRPYDRWKAWTIPYFVVGAPLIGSAFLAGFAADEINHYVVHPATWVYRRVFH